MVSRELQDYIDYNLIIKKDQKELDRLRSLIDINEYYNFLKTQKENFFTIENEIKDSIKEFKSESGKYKIIISRYKTSSNGWNYSQGKVYCNNIIISIINRNYPIFPFLFIENHPNGHDYLICGEDYQCQTIIELDSGNRVEHISKNFLDGIGFCCTNFIKFNPEYKLLLVSGGYWGGISEYRFFDFSAPLSNLEFLSQDKDIIDYDLSPIFCSDRTIKTFEVCDETGIITTELFVIDGKRLILL